jgi:hypothetical protein
MQLFIGYISLVGFVLLSSLLIYDLATRKRRNIKDRLMGIAQREDGKEGEDIEPLNAPFMERAIIPIFTKIGGLLARLTPGSITKGIEERCGRRATRKRTGLGSSLPSRAFGSSPCPLL